MSDPRLIVAMDYDRAAPALGLARQLDPSMCRLKVGKELFTAAGPDVVEQLQSLGFQVFLDLKFHDIPNTVKRACRVAADLGVWMLNVHALGGEAMMRAARDGVEASDNRPHLIAVTVLTSLDEAALRAVGLPDDPASLARGLAGLAQRAGLDGCVSSPQEAASLRASLGANWVIVTPGVRPAGSAPDDQRRVMTPAEAVEAGADYLVVGRPVTAADDPAAALRTLVSELR